MIARIELKQEIDRLDEQYLELVYNILRQFPQSQKEKPIIQKFSLLNILATLEEVEDVFPNIDENLPELDNISL